MVDIVKYEMREKLLDLTGDQIDLVTEDRLGGLSLPLLRQKLIYIHNEMIREIDVANNKMKQVIHPW